MNGDQHQGRRRLERVISGIIVLVLLGGCLLVLRPFLSALLWAAVLCFSTWPIYKRLLWVVRGHRTFAAIIMSLLMIVVVLLPFVVIAAAVSDNVRDLTAAANEWINSGVPAPPPWLGKIPLFGHGAVEHWQALAADRAKLIEESKKLIEPLSVALLVIGKVVGNGLLALALSIFIALFFFRDGESIAQHLNAMVDRVAGERGRRLLQLAGATVRGVVYGILGTALVQGVLAGIGFLIAGVPGAGILALLTFFLSVVPVGPPLIWVPAVLWLFHQGSPGWAVFMLVWGIGVSSIDNVVKPWLISQGSDMPFLLILFGVLGGAITFGFIGVFLGPTLLAVGYRLISEWEVGPTPLAVTKTE
jgi:predicted PurR-regulated permease PerM